MELMVLYEEADSLETGRDCRIIGDIVVMVGSVGRVGSSWMGAGAGIEK